MYWEINDSAALACLNDPFSRIAAEASVMFGDSDVGISDAM
jgi:hypothetical protein